MYRIRTKQKYRAQLLQVFQIAIHLHIINNFERHFYDIYASVIQQNIITFAFFPNLNAK